LWAWTSANFVLELSLLELLGKFVEIVRVVRHPFDPAGEIGGFSIREKLAVLAATEVVFADQLQLLGVACGWPRKESCFSLEGCHLCELG